MAKNIKCGKIIADVKAKALELGFKEDRFGHLQRDSASGKRKLRLKFQPISLRLESKVNEPGHQWFLMDSEFYKNVIITEKFIKIDRLRITGM